MTHEFKKIIENYQIHQSQQEAVLATVVDLKGSSYRKPGVRMLIFEDGQMIGAVSGGCVEKAVYKESLEVFETGKAKMMTYDGRFRLGCEGMLFILIEPFRPSEQFINAFYQNLETRHAFEFVSFYTHDEGFHAGIGSLVKFSGSHVFPIHDERADSNQELAGTSLPVFVQKMPPCFKLVIIGGEHDAVQLCLFASLNGWEVTVVTDAMDHKTKANFPGSNQVIPMGADQLSRLKIDHQTAIVLMTHNFAKDFNFLMALQDQAMSYIGMLGPVKRREKLLNQLLHYSPDVNIEFLDKLHGPAGLNIGAVTPQEIAISIISEILAVTTQAEPMSLSKKTGAIHANSIEG